jgi:hypothetical protein
MDTGVRVYFVEAIFKHPALVQALVRLRLRGEINLNSITIKKPEGHDYAAKP